MTGWKPSWFSSPQLRKFGPENKISRIMLPERINHLLKDLLRDHAGQRLISGIPR